MNPRLARGAFPRNCGSVPSAHFIREMAARYQMSLAGLLQDAMLAYQGHVATGYQPGTAREEWKAEQTEEVAEA